MTNRKVRVRSKRLSQIDESKLALAVWLMAREIVDNEAGAEKKSATDDDNRARGKEAA
jgi:hypothetical protein